ncbi:MAG: UvrD-helicase domain-containing protein [Candidatus Heimdallarchaeota archaeon]|nr:UvrD-helicase domain-containing protein [Candidatus Heimdallarchaeota archaeon]
MKTGFIVLLLLVISSIIGIIFYLFFSKRKGFIRSRLLKLNEEKDNLISTNINKLLSYDNYLTNNKKCHIESKLHVLRKKAKNYAILWNNFVININEKSNEVTSFKEIIEEIDKEIIFIEEYNHEYIKRQLLEYKDFFNGVEFNQDALNDEQIRAILTNDNYNLVVAGPGSGKTKLLTDRVAFYILKKGMNEKDILVLAYNKSAAEEVNIRLKNNYGIDRKIATTFHGFGFSIINKNISVKTDRVDFIGKKKNKILKEIIDQSLKEDSHFQWRYFDYIDKYLNNIDFEAANTSDWNRKISLLELQKTKDYEAIDGTMVKSFAEKEIANFFIRNDIIYEYEKKVDWHDNSNERNYHPDFYLTDYDIYLEHWTISKKGKIPYWYDKNPQDYLKERKWKLNQFKKHKKILWETDYNLWKSGFLEKKLLELCKSYNIQLTPLSNKALIEKIEKTIENSFDAFFRGIKGAIESIKVFGSSYSDFAYFLGNKKDKLNRREESFFKIVFPILRKYEIYLEQKKLIDFEDMINKAYKLLENNEPNNPNPKYKMILVDEFQDISRARLKLLQNAANQVVDCRVFCVGDDWQSIYGFSGASNKYMLEFDKFVSSFEEIKLIDNFRNPQEIIDFGSKIISECTDYISKELISTKAIDNPIVMEKIDAFDEFDFNKKQAQKAYELIKELLKNGTKPSEIMVLSRFNYGYGFLREECKRNIKIEIEVLKEGERIKKGIRFYSIHKSKGLEAEHVIVLNLFAGTYGLPSEIISPYSYELINEDLSNPEDEEKRLFFVAMTRAKLKVYFFTWNNFESAFLNYMP